jgi:hypothetical protein
VVSNPQQQCWQALRHERSTWCSGRKLAFDRGDEALHERAAALKVHGTFRAHLGAYPLHVPPRPAPLGRNDAVGLQHVADRLMGALTVELGIRQCQGAGHSLGGDVDQRAPRGAVIGGAVARGLGPNQLPLHLPDHGPLQSVVPGEAFASSVGPLHEEGADRPWHELVASTTTRAWLSGGGTSRWRTALKGRPIEPAEKAVDRGIIGHVPQPQGGAQLCVFGQPDFRSRTVQSSSRMRHRMANSWGWVRWRFENLLR